MPLVSKFRCAIPDATTCTSDNKRKSLKATHARDQKTRADIITMNSALADVFLANLPKAIHDTYEPVLMKDPNTVLLYMFYWFIKRYGKTTTEYCEVNRQAKGFEHLATHLFIVTSYVSTPRHPMQDCDVIDIGLHVIKCCGMYSKEYKNWIARENESRQGRSRSSTR